MINDCSGGYHDFPIQFSGIHDQKCCNSINDLFVNFTETFPQPYTELRSQYNYNKWNLAVGTANDVLCKYPISWANYFLLIHRLFRLAALIIAQHLAYNFSFYLGVSMNNFYETSKLKPKCLITVVGVITDFFT